MEFGFSLPSRGLAATMQNMRLLAQHVEAVGSILCGLVTILSCPGTSTRFIRMILRAAFLSTGSSVL